MGKARLEAFSDGVMAIIITIMVLELKIPHGGTIEDLTGLFPVFLSYILSFVYIGIYWSNHHHMIHTCKTVTGGILWANLHLLFWLSLVPWTTGWMGENHFLELPTLMYGVVLLMAALAYFILQRAIMVSQGAHSVLKSALGRDWKGKISPVIYMIAVILAHWWPMASLILYFIVAAIWLVPDTRIERMYDDRKNFTDFNRPT